MSKKIRTVAFVVADSGHVLWAKPENSDLSALLKDNEVSSITAVGDKHVMMVFERNAPTAGPGALQDVDLPKKEGF